MLHIEVFHPCFCIELSLKAIFLLKVNLSYTSTYYSEIVFNDMFKVYNFEVQTRDISASTAVKSLEKWNTYTVLNQLSNSKENQDINYPLKVINFLTDFILKDFN